MSGEALPSKKEVEFACGHSVAHEEDCAMQKEISRLRAALERAKARLGTGSYLGQEIGKIVDEALAGSPQQSETAAVTNHTTERYAFEEWLVEQDICTADEAIDSRAGDSYLNAKLQTLWCGWYGRARSALETKE